MLSGGRILHHLATRLPNKKNTILFVGYQAEGTRGRAMVNGARSIKIYGEHIPVNAQVEMISGLSGHADYNEILAWLMGFNRPPVKTFIVHGEPDARESMAKKIRSKYNWNVSIPSFAESFILNI